MTEYIYSDRHKKNIWYASKWKSLYLKFPLTSRIICAHWECNISDIQKAREEHDR